MIQIKPILTIVMLFFSTSLSGCFYGIKTIPEDLKQGISSALMFETVIQNPEASIGEKILWGGVILKATVYESGTVIEIIQKPLDWRDRPIDTDQSGGRFLLEKEGIFLDPAIYQEGREMTLVGEITKEERRPLGEMVYRYPYVRASHIHLWKKRPKHIAAPYPPFPHCRYPFWYGCPDHFYPSPYFYRDPFRPQPYPFSPYRPPLFFRDHLHKAPSSPE